MFLSSILGVWSYFRNPWIWVFTIALCTLYFLFLIAIRLATRAGGESDPVGPGCLAQFLGVFVQATIISGFILLLLPILLGISHEMNPSTVEPLGFVAVRAGLLALIIVTVATFFPLIGPFLASSPGIEGFWIAILSFRFMSPLYVEAALGQKPVPTGTYPATWETLGYFFMALILTRFLFFLFHQWARKFPEKRIFLVSFLGPSVDILGGILPFFMYAWYVGSNLQMALRG